jgi:hypothetical protein
MTPTGHGDRESSNDNQDLLPRVNRGIDRQGSMTEEEEEEGCGHKAATEKRGWSETWGGGHQSWFL